MIFTQIPIKVSAILTTDRCEEEIPGRKMTGILQSTEDSLADQYS